MHGRWRRFSTRGRARSIRETPTPKHDGIVAGTDRSDHELRMFKRGNAHHNGSVH
jgi:hypothetical protein